MPTRTTNGPSTKKKSKTAATPAPLAVARRPQAQPQAKPKPTLVQVPAKSAAKAQAAFKNFSLSKFSGTTRPANYVGAGQKVAEVHQAHIVKQLKQLPPGPTRMLTLAMPPALIAKLLPSYDASKGTVNLGEVMTVLQQNMRGTEFFANGNATLNRLDIEQRARDLVQSVIQGAKK